MKSMTAIAALLLAAAVTLSSCGVFGGRNIGCESLMNALLEDQPHREGDSLYIYGRERGESGYISPLDLGRLYYPGTESVPDELDKLSDYAVYLSACAPDGQVCEIHILKVRNRSERKVVEEMASHRARDLSRPDISSGFPGAKATVYCRYDYVFLLVSSDAESIVARAGSFLG